MHIPRHLFSILFAVLLLAAPQPVPLGCFEEDSAPHVKRLVINANPHFAPLTIKRCRDVAYAGQWYYYGLQEGRFCVMGHNADRALSSPRPSGCGDPCTGNSSQACGAWAENQMFSVPGASMLQYVSAGCSCTFADALGGAHLS